MDTQEQILQYLREASEEERIEIDQDTELIESGIIDSFSITSLILFLEDLYGIEIDINEQTLRALTSARCMQETFDAKQEG